MEQPTPALPDSFGSPSPPRHRWRLALGAGALAGALAATAFGSGVSLAGAQSGDAPEPTEDADSEGPELDGATEAVIDEAFAVFEQCLADNGVPDHESDVGLTDEEWDALDGAFETCEADLDAALDASGVDFEMFEEGIVDDPEIEALFDELDACMAEQGIDPTLEDSGEPDLTEEQMASIDAAFEQCEPILDELDSLEGEVFFGECEEFGDHDDPEDVEETAGS